MGNQQDHDDRKKKEDSLLSKLFIQLLIAKPEPLTLAQRDELRTMTLPAHHSLIRTFLIDKGLIGKDYFEYDKYFDTAKQLVPTDVMAAELVVFMRKNGSSVERGVSPPARPPTAVPKPPPGQIAAAAALPPPPPPPRRTRVPTQVLPHVGGAHAPTSMAEDSAELPVPHVPTMGPTFGPEPETDEPRETVQGEAQEVIHGLPAPDELDTAKAASDDAVDIDSIPTVPPPPPTVIAIGPEVGRNPDEEPTQDIATEVATEPKEAEPQDLAPGTPSIPPEEIPDANILDRWSIPPAPATAAVAELPRPSEPEPATSALTALEESALEAVPPGLDAKTVIPGSNESSSLTDLASLQPAVLGSPEGDEPKSEPAEIPAEKKFKVTVNVYAAGTAKKFTDFTDSISFVEKRTISVGRLDEAKGIENDVKLADTQVSSHHAMMEVLEDGNIKVTDLNSLNGTWYLGKRVKEAVVGDGAEIGLGSKLLVIHIESCPEWAKASPAIPTDRTPLPAPPVFPEPAGPTPDEIGDLLVGKPPTTATPPDAPAEGEKKENDMNAPKPPTTADPASTAPASGKPVNPTGLTIDVDTDDVAKVVAEAEKQAAAAKGKTQAAPAPKDAGKKTPPPKGPTPPATPPGQRKGGLGALAGIAALGVAVFLLVMVVYVKFTEYDAAIAELKFAPVKTTVERSASADPVAEYFAQQMMQADDSVCEAIQPNEAADCFKHEKACSENATRQCCMRLDPADVFEQIQCGKMADDAALAALDAAKVALAKK